MAYAGTQNPFSERQEEELKVLESIYGDDFKDVRVDDKWKVPRPPEILLYLTPQESMSGRKEVHAHVSLRAKFPSNYPESVPELFLEDPKGLSDEVLKELTESLKEKATALVSEVMMLELAQIVQELLHRYNRPTLSIYEENKKYKLEQEEREKRKLEEMKKKRRDYERREIEQEIKRREEEKNLKKENNKKRGISKDRSESGDQDSSNSPTSDSIESPSEPVTIIEFNTKSPRQIYRGKCIGKGPSGCVVHIGIDKDSGHPVAVHKWIIPHPTKKKALTNAEQAKVSKYLKAVKAVEQELHSLLKMHHPNLVNYLAMRYTEEADRLDINILQEFVAGTSLQLKISEGESVALELVRNIAEQLLTALNYLHSHSVVHKDLKASCVFLDTKGTVKLSDYSIGKRLADLYKESHVSQPGVSFTDDSIPSRNSKKGDILKLGMLIFSLVQGRNIKQYPPDIPSKLPASFQDFLNKCLAVEDRLRFTASELLEHDFIKLSITDDIDFPSDQTNSPDSNCIPRSDDSDSDDSERRRPDPTLYTMPSALQLSRLHSEFKEMQWLGKGGFGDVVKVRNNLDGRFYAIKRILLDPRKSQFNKKITREVKLLSRLNHDNVVRYYNSWIETLQGPEDASSETSSSFNTSSKINDRDNMNSLGLVDDIENLAPPPVANSYSDWASVDNYSFKADADDEDDDDEEDVFANMMYEPEEESVLFEDDGNVKDAENETSVTGQGTEPTTEATTTDDSSQNDLTKCYLYIQMEYCEKSTLREAIEEGLYDDKARMWRLFRETLDGLVHIHEQGMIHRDLKPQNIFLDSNNHIKIGDFGLATSHNLGTATTASLLDLASSKSEGGDSALTGRIGTALYVAPELNKVGSRTIYNQKVDMYSLGIIFFEMCYAGLQTKMERVKVLGNIRLEEIRFPDDWDEASMHNEAEIIRWCLTHKSEKRPTAAELLRSHLVPAPALEKSHVVKSVRQALQDPHSGPHRLLMQEIFNRPDNRKDDVFYDIDMHRGLFNSAQHLMQERVHAAIISILKRHGAVRVTPPLLAPRTASGLDDEQEEEDRRMDATQPESELTPAATFMDMSGTVVTLPYDLRVPFARYISRNGVHNLKRYAIEKVFRKVKIHRSHPKELWECAFDIVTPTVCNLIPDAEAISFVSEVISTFPVLLQRSYTIIVNHTVLLHAIFAHSGIRQDKHDEVKRTLTEAKVEKASKSQLQTRLGDLSLTSQQVSTLCSFIDQQGPLSKIQSLLKPLTRNKQSAVSSQARQGLHELEALRKNLDAFGVKMPVIVHLGFVHNLHQYSGIVFQVSAEVKKQKKTMNEVLAAGGRYDDLVQRMALPQLSHAGVLKNHDSEIGMQSTRKHCAFGVSIAVERIVSLSLAEYHGGSKNAAPSVPIESYSCPHPLDQSPLSTVDVLVAVMGRSQLFQERIRILRDLWDAGIHAEMTLEGEGSDADSLEVLQELAMKRSITHLVLLKDKDNLVKVRSHTDAQGFSKQQEKSLNAEDLVDYLLKKIKEGDDTSLPASRHNTDHSSSSNLPSLDTVQPSTGALTHHGTRRLNVDIVSPDKLSYHIKKRYEAQVLAHLASLPILQHLNGKTEIYVLAADLPGSAIKTLALELELNQSEEEFNKSVANAIAKLPKYKKYMARITDLISEAKFHKDLPLIIVYSYKDDVYRLLS